MFPHRKKKFLFSLISILGVLLLFASSCNRGNREQALWQSSILNRLPQGTIGFVNWNFNSSGSQNFSRSSFGQTSAKIWEHLEKFESEKLRDIVDGLKRTGLLATSENQSNPVNEGLAVIRSKAAVNEASGSAVSAGLFLTAAKGINFLDKASAIQSYFANKKFSIEKLSFGGVEGFSIGLGDVAETTEIASIPVNKVYVGASEAAMALAFDKGTVQDLFTNQSSDVLTALTGSRTFQEATQGFSDMAGQIGFAYFDFQKLTSALADSSKISADDRAKIEELPFTSLAALRSFTEQLHDRVAFTVRRENQSKEARQLTEALQTDRPFQLTKVIPGNSLVSLIISGKTVSSIASAAESSVPSNDTALLKLLSAIQEIGIFGQAGGASPYPQIGILLKSSQPETLRLELKQYLLALVQSFGLQLSWQKKTLNDVEVDYVMTPLLLGAYLAQSDDIVILASTESALSDAIRAKMGKAKVAVDQVIPAKSRAIVENENAILFARIDFPAVADLVESIQGTVAMFSGGDLNSALTQVNEIRTLGTSVTSIVGSANTVRIDSFGIPPAQPAG